MPILYTNHNCNAFFNAIMQVCHILDVFFQCLRTQIRALLPFLYSSFVVLLESWSVIPVTITACSGGTVRVTHKLFFIRVVCYYFGESGGGKASFQMETGNPSVLWSVILHVQKWNAQTSLAVKKSSYHHFHGICHILYKNVVKFGAFFLVNSFLWLMHNNHRHNWYK